MTFFLMWNTYTKYKFFFFLLPMILLYYKKWTWVYGSHFICPKNNVLKEMFGFKGTIWPEIKILPSFIHSPLVSNPTCFKLVSWPSFFCWTRRNSVYNHLSMSKSWGNFIIILLPKEMLGFKAIILAKNKILLSFIHPPLVSNLFEVLSSVEQEGILFITTWQNLNKILLLF